VVLNGSTPIAGRLSDRRDALRDEVCAIAEALDDVWIEKLVLRTAPPKAHVVTSANDAIGILNETLGDPALLALLAEDLKPFLDGLPTDACEAGGLQEAARSGRLSELLAAASVALRERLTAEAG
jgi:hypothetical protein